MYTDTDLQTSGLFIRESQRSYSVKEYYWIYLLYSLSAGFTYILQGIVLRNIHTPDFNSIYTAEPYIYCFKGLSIFYEVLSSFKTTFNQ